MLVLEVKGQDSPQNQAKRAELERRWQDAQDRYAARFGIGRG